MGNTRKNFANLLFVKQVINLVLHLEIIFVILEISINRTLCLEIDFVTFVKNRNSKLVTATNPYFGSP